MNKKLLILLISVASHASMNDSAKGAQTITFQQCMTPGEGYCLSVCEAHTNNQFAGDCGGLCENSQDRLVQCQRYCSPQCTIG